MDLVGLKPILRNTTSFSALTLLVGSFDPQKPSPKWPIMCLVGRQTLLTHSHALCCLRKKCQQLMLIKCQCCLHSWLVLHRVITSAMEVMQSTLVWCLFVRLLATLLKNFQMDCTKFSLEVGNAPMNKWMVAIQITDPDPYRDADKTCLGGGMHCPSASSYILNTPCWWLEDYYSNKSR